MRVLWAMSVSIAAVLVVVPAVMVLGVFLHDVPYFGMASFVFPQLVPRLLAAALLGGAVAGYCWWRRRGRLCAVLMALAVLALGGASVITARMVVAVERAGADISLVRTSGIGAAAPVRPDAEVAYATHEGQQLGLSIYRPARSPAPVLVYVHGGGWVMGSRDDRGADLRWFADQGWLTVSVDYTLSSRDRHLWDVTQGQLGCALAWIGRNARQYGGDPTRLSLTGDSAGGGLAVNTGYLAATRTLPSSCGGPIPPVGAVSTLYPVVDPAGLHDNDDPALGSWARELASAYTGGSPREFPQRYASISSASHLSGAAPPTLMIVGEADHLVPPQGAYRFAEQARDHGVDVELVRVPYADHVFDGPPGSIGRQAYRQLTVIWLRDHGQAP